MNGDEKMGGYLLVGTYTTADSPGCADVEDRGKGIYCYEYDSRTGLPGQLTDVHVMVNPSYLEVDSTGHQVLAVSEVAEDGVVYLCSQEAGKLQEQDSLFMRGAASCHVALEEERRLLAVSNYMSGSLGVASIKENQKLEWRIQVKYQGRGTDPVRQEMSHVHSCLFHRDRLFAADLGLDQIHVFQLKEDRIVFKEHICTEAGSGPRHMAVYETYGGIWLYVVNELSCELSVYRCRDEGYAEIQREPLYDGICAEGSLAADVHITENGILYASIRGEDRILWFGIQKDSGKLTRLGSVESGGRGPRSFCFDREEKHLIVANQQSSNLAIFEMEHGIITGEEPIHFSVPLPVKVLQIDG